uniref:Integrin beta n=1 Tax=Bombyx mori TaxID=7091 RepID=A0A076JQI1_BOMMO|nr:integrin beta2 [Bombyx mori]
MFRLTKVTVLMIYFCFASGTSICGQFKTCSSCISYASERCVWCSEAETKHTRCQPEIFASDQTWCNSSFIYNPKFEKFEEQHVPYQSVDDHGRKTIVTPGHIKIKVRPGVPVDFKMLYKPIEHFPLDVYFLMDNSYTMRQFQNELKSQAINILKELSAFTKNVRLGFGTFVEKPVYPYYDKNRYQKSIPFENVLSLTADISKLNNTVRQIDFGSNFDDQEAGLDALMQVMTCTKEIGWRTEARRIIVLFTDAPYHSMGDGKMIGILKPNDMECHLKDNIYDDTATTQDYPSVSQINKVATERNFKIIFATIERVSEVYKELSNAILGSETAILIKKEEGESNIVPIIKTAYLEAESVVRLVSDFPSSVNVKYSPDCNEIEKKNCRSTHLNPIVEINVTIVAGSCLDGNSSRVFKISPHGLHDIDVGVELEVDCQCECEKVKKEKSPVCFNAAYLLCGVCICDSDSKESNVAEDLESPHCRYHGQYVCGRCICKPGYSGDTCEYDDNLCMSNCKKGTCYMGKCNCQEGWSPPNCMCPVSNKDCIAPWSDENEVCFGNGECKCGECSCDKVSGKNESYFGTFCDLCTDCAAKYCKKYEDYVYCNYLNEKAFCDQSFLSGKDTVVKIVNSTEIINDNIQKATWCAKLLDNGTSIVFKYHHEDNKLFLTIQKEKQIPPKANLYIVVGSVISAIVLIGLLTLIGWKVLTDIYDQREYRKVEEAAKAAGFDVSNPCYENPTTEFPNPSYRPTK